MRTTSPFRRLAFAAGLLIAVLVACGREITGPISVPVNALRRVASFAFEPKYETAIPANALHAALQQVAFERVRITLRREDGTIALDTVVLFPVGADELTLTLNVPLPASAPSTGVPLSLSLGYINAAGDTVFKGGPLSVNVTPSTGGAPPPPVQVPVHYTGPGASATSVVISPKSVSGLAGQSRSFSAQALGPSGQVIAGTPVVFATSNEGVVTVNSTTGSAELMGRGTAQVYALLLTGPRDSATVTVTLPAARLTLSAGGDQTVAAGTSLPQAIVARVLASDGVGVGGVTVNFAASGGGTATPASSVSDASGNVSTQWKLGPTAGAQSLTVTSTGLTGSPLTVNATALAVTPTKLTILAGPVSGTATTALPAVTVAAQDAAGNLVTNFTGDVTVAIGVNPGGSTLSGTTTVKAVAGIATFGNLKLNRPGTGYSLVFSSADLSSATSNSFSITVGDASSLVFGAVPSAVDAGLAIVPAVTVSATDAAGNPVTTFTGAVTVGLGANPGGASLSGTLTRNAVGGIATFDNLSLNRSGSSYTLTASATGLTGATSAPFNVSSGSASVIAVVSGVGQTAVIGSVLKPIVLQLRDAQGNGVSRATLSLALDIPVALMDGQEPAVGSTSPPSSLASGYGSLSAYSVTTDATGGASFTWTLGLMTGMQRVIVTLTSPTLKTYITATAVAGTAANLVVSTAPSSTQTAGVPLTPSLVVQARDSLNALQAAFTGSVVASIVSGPAGAILDGTISATAASGAATFSNLRLRKAGTYLLQFSSTGLNPATTMSFFVAAAPATTLVADSGNGQSGGAGAALVQPLVVLVTDSVGNPVSGAPLSWTVTAGGGSLTGTSSATDTFGRGRASLTLGAAAGANTATATSTGLAGSPVIFTATGTVGAATQLVITQQPPATVTAGAMLTPAITVEARDASNNKVTTFTGVVTAALGTNPTSATLGDTLTVTAVGGVATFPALKLVDKGTGYTLTFAASGLASATSTAFNITPAAATQIAADSGNSQSGAVGGTLPQPLVVKVLDAYGNPVSGTSVSWAVTSGGGSLDSTNTTTSATGRARVSLTLGAVAGSVTVTAISTGLTGSPVTFTTTATAAAATQLVINRQPRASSTSGAADTITVDVKDAGGNVVAGSTASVTLSIATGPAGATFMGPATVAAVNGVATFIGTAFDKMGSYTLSFSSAGLTSATSSAFSITAGWPEYVAVDSGGAQTGSAGQPLPNPLVAKLTDQYGNKVVGRTVYWAVATGGGSLANSTTVSDTGGRVRTQWSLGLTPGAQTATATAADTGLTTSTATFSATANAVSFNKLWTGATSTDWNTAGNWSPAGVPVATDSVRVGASANAPVLAAHTTVARLGMDLATSLSLATYQLTVNGSIDVPAIGFAGSTGSKVILGGATGSTIVGVYGTDVQFSGGNYSMTGGVTVNGSVSITAGKLGITMHGVTVSGDFSTSGTGVLNQSAAMLSVAGSVSFGGTGVSSLTGGDLAVAGNFTAASPALVSMIPPHNVKFNGTSPQTITLTPGSSVAFANVELSGAGAKTLATGSQMMIDGTAFVLAGSGPFTGAARTGLRGPGIIDSTAGSWNVDSIFVAIGTVTKLPPTLPAKLVQISSGGIQLTSNVALPNANVFVYSGTLDINGQTLSIGKDFRTASTGLLRMMSGTGSLAITGHAFFDGADESGQLTAGTLVINGNFTQGTNPGAFKAAPGHVTRLTGTANQSVSFEHPDLQYTPGCVNSCFGQLLSDKTAGVVTFLSDVKADSSMLVTGVDTLKALGRILHARGDFSSNGRADGAVFAKYLRYAGVIARTGGLFSVDTLVAFGAAPTLMAFETLPLVVKGTATLPARIYNAVIVDSTAGTLQASGKDTVGTLITRNGGRLKMVNAADSLFVQKDATFGGGAATGLLTAGTLVIGGNLQVTGAALDASGTHTTVMRSDTARVLSADPQGGVYGFQNLGFAGTGAKNVRFSGSSAINVKGKMIAHSGSGLIGTDSTVSQVWMRPGSSVIDSTASADAFRFARLMVDGVNALPPRLAVGDLMVTGAQLLYDTLTTTSSVTINGGLLDLNGHRVRMIGSNTPFLTSSGGRLQMTNPADSLWADNGNDIYFAGGSTDGLLTDGRIIASGSFQAGGAGADLKAFAATANHWVALYGSGSRRLKMLNAGFTSSHFAKLVDDLVDTLYLKSDVVAESFVTGAQPNHFVRADTGAAPLFTVKGASISSAVFDGVRLALVDGAAVTALTNVSFINQDPAAAQLTISRSGTGTTGSIPALGGTWAFATTPTTGKYFDVQDTDGASPDALNVNFSGTVSPAAHGGKVLISGGATTNWPFGLSLTAAAGGGDWNTASTWTPAYVPTANDDVTINSPSYVTLTGTGYARHVTLGMSASLMLSAATLRVSGNVSAPNGYVSGSGSTIIVTGAGTHTLNIGSIPSLTVEADAVATAAGTLSIGGDAIIHGRLVPDGNFVNVSGILDIRAGGALKMTKAADSVVVNSAIFAGVASGDSLLTDGKLAVSNSLTQSGVATSFAPTGNHVTWVSGGGSGPSLMASRTRLAAEAAVLAPRRASATVPNTIQFANPGWSQSRFNILRLNHTNDAAMNLSSDVYALRAEGVGMSYTMRALNAASPVRFYVKGSSLKNLSFNGVALQVDAGGVIDTLEALTFSNQDSTASQMTLNLDASRTLKNITFETPPTSGKYLSVNSVSGSPVVTMASPTPGAHGGYTATGGGASIVNWAANRAMASRTTGSWSDTASWNPYGVPSRYDDISLASGHSITMTSSGEVRNATLAASSGLIISYASLKVFGNWSADTLSSNSTSAGTVQFVNTSTVSGRLGATTFDAPVTINGTSIFGSVSTRGGAFDVSSQNVRVTGTFETDSVGYLKMTNASGLLRVDGDATFNGASTNTRLTDGVLRLNAGLFQAGDPAAFSATGSHRTILTGESFSANASFANPGATTTTSHFGIVQVGDTGSRTLTLESDVYAVTSLVRGTSGMAFARGGSYGASQAPIVHVSDINSSVPLSLNATLLHVTNATNATAFSNAQFFNTNIVGKDALTVETSSGSAVTLSLSGLTFPVPVDTTSFRYVVANYLGTGGSLTLNLTGMTPISSIAVPSRIYAGLGASINWSP